VGGTGNDDSDLAHQDLVNQDLVNQGGDLAHRVARLEAVEQIRQLASRYALALDMRDLDSLVGLYVDDVRVTRTESGRPAMRAAFDQAVRQFATSIHFVGNHVIELDDDDPDRATGVVYCRAEHAVGDQWVVVPLQYEDAYERRDGRWYFRRRRILTWYETDVESRPARELPRRWPGRPPAEAELPGAWATWHEFWGDTPPG
jgi:ketosteroid isomerase-like protein